MIVYYEFIGYTGIFHSTITRFGSIIDLLDKKHISIYRVELL